jgi:hypothetical protein
LRKFDTPTVTEFRKAQDVVDRFYDRPKYKGLSLEEGEEVDRILFEVAPKMQLQYLRANGEELERADAIMASANLIRDPDAARFLFENFGRRAKLTVRQRRRGRRSVTFRSEPKDLTNPERTEILLENQDLLSKFYPDLLERQLSREEEAALGQAAFSAVSR